MGWLEWIFVVGVASAVVMLVPNIILPLVRGRRRRNDPMVAHRRAGLLSALAGRAEAARALLNEVKRAYGDDHRELVEEAEIVRLRLTDPTASDSTLSVADRLLDVNIDTLLALIVEERGSEDAPLERAPAGFERTAPHRDQAIDAYVAAGGVWP